MKYQKWFMPVFGIPYTVSIDTWRDTVKFVCLGNFVCTVNDSHMQYC